MFLLEHISVELDILNRNEGRKGNCYFSVDLDSIHSQALLNPSLVYKHFEYFIRLY
jgi:hypothetical protein